ncbi:iron chelate uptake ABC transporter family permease subunit [Enterovibrio sp. ZSDZ35]|uniref:Iron chelate uptake ABC transporter family permease subunit n=1 Tax=Enterovibrio qingdaonensis TaxID=2899818 RepID=A0ABT5QTK3_9GAMM|nr:iron chelate uptake ABC transporter family permease subunit [Enterovibrio sp. ZSDZ35]MDD1784313.1 iron chelate uptake ABC transporter family permease subunit [Enterovibrio sp. ZSDZ35]
MSDNKKILTMAFTAIVFAVLFIGIGLTATNYGYFLSHRVPKVLAIIVAGIAVALSSLTFQTITHNRILTPSIMGFDALYMLTQTLLVSLFGGFSLYIVNAYWNFAIATSVMVVFSLLLFGFYFAQGGRNLIVLLLVGLILGQVFGSSAAFLTMLMDPNEFLAVQSKMFASFNNINVELVYFCAPLLLLVSVLLFRDHQTLDVFWLDRDNATSLGVDVAMTTRRSLILSSVLIAISTALIGPVMFFGLLVTNLTRELFRTYQHNVLLIGCSLMSVCTLLAGQWAVENIFQFETTLSVVVNFVGGAYFIWMLLKNKVV